jgi:hypothetical protein
MPDRDESMPDAPRPQVHEPEQYEDAQGFRETFLLYVTDQHLNGAFRVLGATTFEMILEHCRHWPRLPGPETVWELQAALGDIRHLQGFLAYVGREREASDPSTVDADLSALAEVAAMDLGEVGDRIQEALVGRV